MATATLKPDEGKLLGTVRFVVVFAAIYALCYVVGVAFYFPDAKATTFWLTNGFLLGVLLTQPKERRIAAVATSIVSHLILVIGVYHERALWGFGTTTVDTIEPLVCLAIINRRLPGRLDSRSLRHMLVLAAAVVLGTAIAALFGAWLVMTRSADASFFKAWRLWWFGDLLGGMLIAPLVVAINGFRVQTLQFVKPARLIEAGCVGIATLLVTHFSFCISKPPLPQTWLFPILMWASLRFHPRIVYALMMTAIVIIVSSAVHGHGPFATTSTSPMDVVFNLQQFIAMLAVSILIVSSITADRERVLEGRNIAEAEIRVLNVALEGRVAVRTAELAAANSLLSLEVEERQRTQVALQARNEELKGFAYTVSHDLKAPLRGIAGYAQELERRHAATLPERGHFCISQILTATGNLDRLIEDLLKYSRLDSDVPTRSLIHLPTVIDKVLNDRSHVIAEYGTEVNVNVSSGELVEWERGLSQVLSNLVDNAIKYSRGNVAPKVDITAESVDDNCTIMVKDNGIGFDMKYHDRMFGLFNRLVRQEDFEGTGAGLAITKKLVEKCGGSLWAESRPGEGATFYVSLPTSPEAEVSE